MRLVGLYKGYVLRSKKLKITTVDSFEEWYEDVRDFVKGKEYIRITVRGGDAVALMKLEGKRFEITIDKKVRFTGLKLLSRQVFSNYISKNSMFIIHPQEDTLLEIVTKGYWEEEFNSGKYANSRI